MTPQQIHAMKLALEALEGFYEYGYDRQECFEHITAIKEALLEHAMRETQRLGQEIDQCQCPECQIKPHASDCAVHSEPAYPKGKCDCGAQPEQEPVAIKRMKEWVEYLKRKSDHGQHMKIPSEMSAGACWELAIELEQFINTTPPQRKPLTDDLYNELLFAVENKYPDETRHQTALRYIKQAEMPSARPAQAAHGIKENT